MKTAAGAGARCGAAVSLLRGIFSCRPSWERAWPDCCNSSPEEEPGPTFPPALFRPNNGPEGLENRSGFPSAAAPGPRDPGLLALSGGRGPGPVTAACPLPQAALGSDAAALRSEVLALRREGAELAGSNAALREVLARGEEEALGLQRRLEEAAEQRRALRARGERCEARQRQLQASLRDYAAEVEALQRRRSCRPAGRRCPPRRKG
ncbi:coiled-coil domain-containing protein 194 isoform X3 [Struthio camelus]|uniref:coiled-coil domain-containing protein 194 isoform X3 n=1 Tax=Struthio camelus TaxID=8801 RepID=UPI003603E92A